MHLPTLDPANGDENDNVDDYNENDGENHLEVADNAASGESFHLNSYIFHLLRNVSLTEKS